MRDDHLLPLNDPTDWHTIAACRGADTAIFFDAQRVREALAYCATCPVSDACKRAGDGEAGVWGGAAPTGDLHACAHCGRMFPRGPGQSPAQRLMCSPACRAEAIASAKARHLAKLRAAREPGPTTCAACGFEARNASGLSVHRRHAHGPVVA